MALRPASRQFQLLLRRTAAAGLAAVVTALLATSLTAQEVAKPHFSPPVLTRVEKACQTLVRQTLTAPASTGDVRAACSCVDDAVEASGFDPAEFLHDEGYGEVLSFPWIASRSRSERPEHSDASKRAAHELYWKAKRCLSNLTLDDSDSPARQAAPRAAVIEGPARERSTGIGALLKTESVGFDTAFRDIMEQRFGLHRSITSYDELASRKRAMLDAESTFYRELSSAAANDGLQWYATPGRIVLACRYDIGQKGFSSDNYYFWDPGVEVDQAVIAKLSADHPIREIHSDPFGCPLRQPQP